MHARSQKTTPRPPDHRRQSASQRLAAAFARIDDGELERRKHEQLIDLLTWHARNAANAQIGVAFHE